MNMTNAIIYLLYRIISIAFVFVFSIYTVKYMDYLNKAAMRKAVVRGFRKESNPFIKRFLPYRDYNSEVFFNFWNETDRMMINLKKRSFYYFCTALGVAMIFTFLRIQM